VLHKTYVGNIRPVCMLVKSGVSSFVIPAKILSICSLKIADYRNRTRRMTLRPIRMSIQKWKQKERASAITLPIPRYPHKNRIIHNATRRPYRYGTWRMWMMTMLKNNQKQHSPKTMSPWIIFCL